jgi:hypothetical protein
MSKLRSPSCVASSRHVLSASALVFTVFSVGSIFLGEEVHAMASGDIRSSIRIISFFDQQLGANNYRVFQDSHYDSGFAIGNAIAHHDSTTSNGHEDLPGGLTSDIQTKLFLHVAADHPFGYATASGWAETGYKINLANAGQVRLDITPDILVDVSTQDLGEYAWANFLYEVTWNGVKVDNLGADLHFFHANGTCRTILCSYRNNTPLTVFVNGVAGENILFIDPISVNNGLATAPAPLPILGTAAVFGSIRKARKFSSQLKVFRMG